jgi:hypothetical protein
MTYKVLEDPAGNPKLRFHVGLARTGDAMSDGMCVMSRQRLFSCELEGQLIWLKMQRPSKHEASVQPSTEE